MEPEGFEELGLGVEGAAGVGKMEGNQRSVADERENGRAV